jgi:hypothetical protein
MLMIDTMFWTASSVFNGALYVKIKPIGSFSHPMIYSFLFFMGVQSVAAGMTMMLMILGCHLIIQLSAIVSFCLHLGYSAALTTYILNLTNELVAKLNRPMTTV